MKLDLRMALLGLAATIASPVAGQSNLRSTAKAVEPFARCFAAAQDRAARPWSFVPRASGGGTFSNAGAAGVRQPYLLDIADRGSRRDLLLTAAGADSIVRSAIAQCV